MKVKKIKNSKLIRNTAYAVVFMAAGAWIHTCITPDMSAFGEPQEPPFVVTGHLEKGDVTERKKYIAQVEAINSVDIVPQVSGYLEQILFENGAEVKEGQKIFVIEQTQYIADVKKAEASVKQLERQYKRVSSLNRQKFASDREIDQAESDLRQAEAALDIARLNLEHTEIKSPINGRIGKALVTKGNLVGPSTGSLARIVQTSPIRIAFSVSDRERVVFMEKIAAAADNIFIDIKLPNGKIETVKPENLFFDNEFNTDTATLPVYIDLQNEDNALVSGNYVDIYVRFSVGKEAILVPQTALMSDASGNYVMTVNKDNRVEQKYITLGNVVEDKQVVLAGLNGDERVIIQGLQKVTPGITVTVAELPDNGGNN